MAIKRAAVPFMLSKVARRTPRLSVSDPPTTRPSTEPAPYALSAAPACTAVKPRLVKNSTRKTWMNWPSLFTNRPTSSAFTAPGDSRKETRMPASSPRLTAGSSLAACLVMRLALPSALPGREQVHHRLRSIIVDDLRTGQRCAHMFGRGIGAGCGQEFGLRFGLGYGRFH